MDDFFADFPDFTPRPGASYHDSFAALGQQRNWSPNGKARTRALRKFREALVLQFNIRFGTDDKSLQSWQSMCVLLGTDPAPGSITQCRKVLKKTHVNLVDLLQAQSPSDIRIFRRHSEMVEYTKETEKYFSLQQAKASGLLKALLREV